ncbi:MATE family efflux transporter [Lacrimispora sp.]|uniref:MATE family efflux transporter n=1 Tax=Lacrimispora sp. TaxID=2719234 RepID=UPI00289AB340|nr:MATE family efflux transporter [Lacrimispora sp.]
MEEQQEIQKERELGTKPILPLFTKYSFYTFVGMIAQCIMVLFEGIIIGNGLGTEGLACVELIMPMEYLMLALGGFFAIGVSTVAGIRLGNNDTEGARTAYGQGTIFTAIFMIILSALIFIFVEPVAKLIGTPPEHMEIMKLFLRIFMFGYPFCVIGHIVVYMARVDEKPGIATWAMTISAIVALLWLYASTYIFKLGIPGSAVYYSISIGIWGLFIVYFIFSQKTIFKIRMEDLHFDWSLIMEILKIGFPFLVVQASSTLFGIVINRFLGAYGTSVDLASYAIINGYVIYILMLINQSITGGMQPIASFNLGEKMYKRIQELIKVSIIGNIIAVGVFTVLFYFGAGFVCNIFSGDPKLVEAAVPALRIAIICSALGLCSAVMSCYFQYIDQVIPSTFLGICRYILFCIPLMMILTKIFGVNGVWYSLPIADLLAFAVSVVFAIREIKRLKKLERSTNL